MKAFLLLLSLILISAIFILTFHPSEIIEKVEDAEIEEKFNVSGIGNFTIENFSQELKIEKPKIELRINLIRNFSRWRKLPINVYIEKKGFYDCSAYEKEILNAIKIWELETGIDFFSLTEDECVNCVIVRCRPQTEIKKEEGEGYVNLTIGEAQPSFYFIEDFSIIGRGIIDIYFTDKQCIYPIRYIHEFGHILGLGHSENKNDVMYEIEDCNQKITEDTKLTLKNLYSKEVDEYLEFLFKNFQPKCEENKIFCNEICWEACDYGYYPVCNEKLICVPNYTLIGCPEGYELCNEKCWKCPQGYFLYCSEKAECIKCSENSVFCNGKCYEYCEKTFVCNETFVGCANKNCEIECYGKCFNKCKIFYCSKEKSFCLE